MASRTSNTRLDTTRRGRALYGDISYDMFPGKYESTEMYEDPEEIYYDRRTTLRDRAPDNSRMFAYEEARRDNYSKDHLNLREGARVLTDPWSNWDTSFHDKDPRGWSTEQPWAEYRRGLEAVLRRTDFKDDGDYSTTSGGIHPNTMYKQIRGAQNWVKSRLAIFDTSLTSMANGGVGVYDNISSVYKSEYDDPTVAMDGSLTLVEDPTVRAKMTMRISNMIGGGSKELQANTTTDHKAKVAAYGKLYGQRGLINHENKLRLIEDDTAYSKLDSITGVPAALMRLMSDKSTMAAGARKNKQALGEKIASQKEHTQDNKLLLTREIVTLLGITENELKLLNSKEQRNNKSAQQALAQIYDMVETVHRTPAHVKLQMRDELLIKSAGQGLTYGNNKTVQQQVVVNPKIITFMEYMTHKSEKPGTGNARESQAVVLGKETPVLVYRSASLEDTQAIAQKTVAGLKLDSKKTISYGSLLATEVVRNKHESHAAGEFMESGIASYGINAKPTILNTGNADTDVDFGENKVFKRHGGKIGSKYLRNQESSGDFKEGVENPGKKKNPKRS